MRPVAAPSGRPRGRGAEVAAAEAGSVHVGGDQQRSEDDAVKREPSACDDAVGCEQGTGVVLEQIEDARAGEAACDEDAEDVRGSAARSSCRSQRAATMAPGLGTKLATGAQVSRTNGRQETTP